MFSLDLNPLVAPNVLLVVFLNLDVLHLLVVLRKTMTCEPSKWFDLLNCLFQSELHI